MPRTQLGNRIRDLFIYSELWEIETKLGLHSHKNRLSHRISPDVIRVSGHPRPLTQTFSIGAAGFRSSKVHKEHSLYELVHNQGHPKLRGWPELVGEVPLVKTLDAAFLVVDLNQYSMNYSKSPQRLHLFLIVIPGHQCFVSLADTFQQVSQDFAHLRKIA